MSNTELFPEVGDTVIERDSGTHYVVTHKAYIGGPTTIKNLVDTRVYDVYLYSAFWRVEPAVIQQATEEPAKTGDDTDYVNNPPHYQRGGLEVIDVLTAFFPENPLLWQVGKYIMRAGYKANTVEDLKKAQFYLKREIARLENL